MTIKKLYCTNLPEFSQINGFFDSTGRRINSFGNILDQSLYILKKFHSLIVRIKLDFQIFFEEILSFILDLETGKNDLCKGCRRKNQKKQSKFLLDSSIFFKWKLLEEMYNWNKKYSFGIKKKFFFGHQCYSTDESVEKIIGELSNKKIYTLGKRYKKYNTPRVLNYPFENLNVYSGLFKIFLSNLKIIKIPTEYNSNSKQSLINFENVFSELNCVFDANKYKESFFDSYKNFYNSIFFMLVWVFFENVNASFLTVEIFSSVFKKSNLYSRDYFKQISDNIPEFNNSSFCSYSQKKNFKKLIFLENLGFYIFSSKHEIEKILQKILKKNLPENKIKLIWLLSIENSSCQKLEWFKTLLKFEKIFLFKDLLIEKIKILSEKFSEQKCKKFKKLVELSDYRIGNLQVSYHKKGYEKLYLFLSIIDSKKKFQIKQVKIKYDLKLVVPLVVFICVKFRISFLFFLFKKKKNENLLLHLKNQLVKFLNFISSQKNESYSKIHPQNFLNLIQCVSVYGDNFENKHSLSNLTEMTKFRKNSFIYVLFQLLLKGPVVYLWYLKKNNFFYKKLKENKPEIFFLFNFPEALYFLINQIKFHKDALVKMSPENYRIQMKNRFSCQLGPQKLFNMQDKINELKKINTQLTSKFFQTMPSLQTHLIYNTLILSFKNIFEFLWNTRIFDFKLYCFLKKVSYHYTNLKWHYKAIYNIIRLPEKFNALRGRRITALIVKESKKKYLSIAIEILSKYISNQFIPKKVHSYVKKPRKKHFLRDFQGIFKSWREKILESNKNGTLEILGNFIRARINRLSGILDNGINFFIEKNEIFNYRLRFENLIFKKLNFFPGKITSVYPKISQIKFSSLVDTERFDFSYQQLVRSPLNYVDYFRPFKFLEEKKNFFFCNTTDILSFIKSKESQNWVIQFIDKNLYNFLFIIDKRLNKYFSFQISIFIDKKHLNYIIQWKKNVYFCFKQFLNSLLDPFEKQFSIIIKNKDFLTCGSEHLMMIIKAKKVEKKRYHEFFFTFIEKNLFKYFFVIRRGKEIKKKGIFTYKSRLYYYGNKKFTTIESLKNMLLIK